MSSDVVLAPYAVSARAGVPIRLAVSWQQPHTRCHELVGLLECDEFAYTFRYLPRARGVDAFQPFLGLEDFDRVYRSERLFPMFAQRVMSQSRADFPRYMEALWLPPGAADWQILDRSQGQREGDGVRVVLEPAVSAAGDTEATFFVNGIRHQLRQNPSVDHHLGRLKPGDRLRLLKDHANPVDPRAVLVAQDSGIRLGWVPSLLLEWTHEVLNHGQPEVQVVRVNGPDVPPGYRVLVQVAGRAGSDFRAFAVPSTVVV